MTLQLSQLLSLPTLAPARVKAGAKSLGRAILSLNVLEVLVEADEDLKLPGHLILTTLAFAGDDEDRQKKVIRALATMGCGGMLLQTGVIKPLAMTVLRLADELHFPIIEVPSTLYYHEIIAAVVGALLAEKSIHEKYAANLRAQFENVPADANAIPQILRIVAKETKLPASLIRRFSAIGIAAYAGERNLDSDLISTHRAWTSENGAYEITGVDVAERIFLSVSGVTPARPLSPRQITVCEESLPFLRTHLVAERRSMRERHDQIQPILFPAKSNVPAPLASDRTNPIGSELQDYRQALLLTCGPLPQNLNVDSSDNRRWPDEASTICQAIIQNAVAVPLDGAIAILVGPAESADARRLQQLAGELVEKTIAATKNPHWRIGIGSAVADFRTLSESLAHARDALTLSGVSTGGRPVITFDDVAVESTMLELSQKKALQQWSAQLIGPLKSERDGRSDLLNTFDIFLDCGSSHKVAAAKLNIHPKSLKYRLDRITALLGVNAFQTERQFAYHLAVKLALVKTE